MKIEDTIGVLREITGFDGDVTPDMTLVALEVDSIDMLEWLYTLDERFSLDLDLDEEALFAGILEISLAEVHARLVAMARPDAASAAR